MKFRGQGRDLFIGIGLAVALTPLFGCGPRASTGAEEAEVKWDQSRANSTQYAYLRTGDYTTSARRGDDFIFGANVIRVAGFVSEALTGSVQARRVTLELSGSGAAKKLTVKEGTRALMAFDVKQSSGGQLEVNFATAGNDVRMRQLFTTEAGRSSTGTTWASTGTPTVLMVMQDTHTAVIDLQYAVSSVIANAETGTSATKSGSVTLRLFLKRASSQATLPSSARRSVASAKAKNLGFFGPALGSQATAATPIQRFALGDGGQSNITFYLKDVPAKFEQTVKEAILSWNAAFDNSPIHVAIAGANQDAGDPRTNVVKWFDGTDNSLSWAGVARMVNNPDTGIVMAGDVYIQGSTLEALYAKIHAFSLSAAAGGLRGMEGTVGNATLDFHEGERPVIPFITDVDLSYDEYMQGYYREVVIHEVGHVLGLRHNFRGSTFLDPNGESSSIMDYAPRRERSHGTGPGSYDRQAIRWGYYGETPASARPFCTDEDIAKFLDCNQGDFGDPIAYTKNALIQGTQLLAQKPLTLTDNALISSMTGVIENTLKIWNLRSTLSATRKAEVERDLPPAYSFFWNAPVAAWLSTADQAKAQKNLDLARAEAQKKLQQ